MGTSCLSDTVNTSLLCKRSFVVVVVVVLGDVNTCLPWVRSFVVVGVVVVVVVVLGDVNTWLL